jgi:hypothetical protein
MIVRCVVGRGVTGAVRYILGEGRDAETGEHAILAAGDTTSPMFWLPSLISQPQRWKLDFPALLRRPR